MGAEPAPGPQCRKEHLALRTAKWVRAEPSGVNAARWGIRSLSIPGVYARGVSIHVQLWSPALQPPLHRAEEARGDEAVQDAMVEGERHVHHVADGDGVVDHDGTLDDRIHRENTRVGLIDDRHRYESAEHAGVVDRKRRVMH